MAVLLTRPGRTLKHYDDAFTQFKIRANCCECDCEYNINSWGKHDKYARMEDNKKKKQTNMELAIWLFMLLVNNATDDCPLRVTSNLFRFTEMTDK